MTGTAIPAEETFKWAMAAYQGGRFEETEQLCQTVLTAKDDYFEAVYLLAAVQARSERFTEAVANLDRAILIRSNSAEAHNYRAAALHQLKRYQEALTGYGQALALRPDYAMAHNNRGHALQQLGRFEEALASYDTALACQPDQAETYRFRGIALDSLKRYEDALASYDKALSIQPGHVGALINRGLTLKSLKRVQEALACYDLALSVQPDQVDALIQRGLLLRELRHFEDALASLDRALTAQPDHAEAHLSRGNLQQDLRRYGEALASYAKALSIRADFPEALNNRGNALHQLMRYEEALACYDRAVAIRPDYANALNGRGNMLRALGRFEEALESYRDALAAEPDHPHSFGLIADAKRTICDWTDEEKLSREIENHVREKRSIVPPFTLLGWPGDSALHFACAKNAVEFQIPIMPLHLWGGGVWRNDKIKIAYLSSDFHNHATAFLMAGLFEQHDRERFEIVGVSLGPDDRSAMRERLARSFDRFYDVRTVSDLEVAQLLHGMQIDIAVDLKGHTDNARLGIFAHRPAPVQVGYLGYPGTTGARFIDYVIADPIVLPFDRQPYYTEKIVHLPECYQVNDGNRPAVDYTPGRREAGLPEEGFVFCCFNKSYKITPDIFAVWMRLLREIEGSVLWLFQSNSCAERNLREEAARHGIDPTRLVFARRIPHDEHLARHRLADLVLDTLPYNAHATASDALWAGVPLVTCLGQAFPGRVAASLLHAAGLPELVTHNLADYEALCLRLARDPSLLGEFRMRLDRNRLTCPLFDTDRFRRHLESAYLTMWRRWQRGERPKEFSVVPGAE